MVYETLINTTGQQLSPVQKKNYMPSKMIKKAFKAACKMFKTTTHEAFASELNRSITSIEDYQNWQNEQLEQSQQLSHM